MDFRSLANPGVELLGVYEPGLPLEEVARKLGIPDAGQLIKLASNENALGPSPLARDAVNAMLGQAHLYPDGGAFYLRKKLAAELGLTPEHIVVGNGSNELIEFLGHVFLSPGRSIVMADRAFVVYRLIAAMFGAEVIDVEMQAHTHDPMAMVDALRDDTRLLFIANPNNPTGTMVDEGSLSAFLDRLPGHVVPVLDEAYIELLPEGRRPDSVGFVREGRPVILLRTFSKAYGLAGLRVGYAIGPPEAMALLQRVRQPFNVNALALAGALAALDDEAHLAATRTMVEEGLAFFEAECKSMNLEFIPSVANFIMVRTGNGRKVFEALQTRGVIARPMDGYRMPEYIRLTVGAPDENLKAMRALRDVLAEAGT